MKKSSFNYIIAFIGIALITFGLLLIKMIDNPQGFLLSIPYVCIGIGCGTFGHGMGNVISHRAIQNRPDIQKSIEIEKNDERNIAIGNRAKAKAYDLMIFMSGALLLIFALMGVDMVIVLLLVFVYLFMQGYAIYYRFKFEKEM